MGCYEGAAAMEMKVLLILDTEMTVDKCVEACFAADQRMAGIPDTRWTHSVPKRAVTLETG